MAARRRCQPHHRELVSFDVAPAIGFLAVAWKQARAYGLLLTAVPRCWTC